MLFLPSSITTIRWLCMTLLGFGSVWDPIRYHLNDALGTLYGARHSILRLSPGATLNVRSCSSAGNGSKTRRKKCT